MGCDVTVPCRHFDRITDALAELRAAGYTIYGVDTVVGAQCYWEAPLKFPAALVLGNEALGISAEALAMCDSFIQLPAAGLKNSINVGNCAAVVLFGLAAVICQSFYALEALSYLTKKLPPRAHLAARRLFILFFALCAYLGAVAPPAFTWGLADLAIGLMTLINLPTVLLALEEIKRRTAEYFG
jgi:hypothetical protein